MSTSSIVAVASGSSNSTATAALDRFDAPGLSQDARLPNLQNQDPTQPVSNTEILQEVSQISDIETNQSLSTTLQGRGPGAELVDGLQPAAKERDGGDSAGQRGQRHGQQHFGRQRHGHVHHQRHERRRSATSPRCQYNHRR